MTFGVIRWVILTILEGKWGAKFRGEIGYEDGYFWGGYWNFNVLFVKF